MYFISRVVFLFIIMLSNYPISASAQDTLHTDITVAGNCDMCQDRIEGIANASPFVIDAWYIIDEKTLHIDHIDQFNVDSLAHILAIGGHDAGNYLASESAYSNLPTCCQYRNQVEVESDKFESEQNMIHTDLFVDGKCGMCQERIEDIAKNFRHVINASWDIQERILHVDHVKQFNEKNLQRLLARFGHDTELIKATTEAYNQLHACCKYRGDGEECSTGEDGLLEGASKNIVQGIILEQNEVGRESALIGANVYWLGTNTGATTDIDGYFLIDREPSSDQLVVSYVGYENDTLSIGNKNHVEIIMSEASIMREVIITHRKKTTEISMLSVNKVQRIGEKELLKAACCNLSESFETNATVDASLTDAVTGARQIQMLGLAGPNIQMTREGIPDIRGLAAIYGLSFTPGTWIEGININTGTGSVVNGFESITGQIDVALKKPDRSERFFFNFYGNEMSRLEANMHFSHRFSDKLATGLLIHGDIIPTKHDNNNDGFLDHPISEQFVGLNRWKFYGNNGLEGQVGIKITKLDSRSGQVNFNHGAADQNANSWGSRMQVDKYDIWGKMGKVFPSKPHASLGLQVAASYFDQNAYFGLRPYVADQTTIYSNLIYQSLIMDTRHSFKTGLSFQLDNYNESLRDMQAHERNETVPGAFFEYAYKPSEKLSVVAGLRGDYHNNFGFFTTPRLHVRFAPSEKTVFRFSGGRGQRTASIFTENIGAFASSRQFQILGSQTSDNPYGLEAEVSWSTGFSFVKEIAVNNRAMVWQFDFYRTSFENQIIVDYDHSPQTVLFYNLDGDSYSNSFQAQVDYELLPRFDIRLAYRLNNVQTTYLSGKRQKAMTNRDRAFLNVQYKTNNDWTFNYTLNWQGNKRLPDTNQNPKNFQHPGRSPDYFVTNVQLNKSWDDKFSAYIGAQNLFNYRQENPILAPDDPFGQYFDASIVWAPVFGRELYAGIRFTIK